MPRLPATRLRVLALSLVLLGLGLAVALPSALADSTGRYWGWVELRGDTVTYNLQIPAPDIAAGNVFLRAKIFGIKADGGKEVICQQADPAGLTAISCSSPKDKYASAYASVRYKNLQSGDGGLFDTDTLAVETVAADPNKVVMKTFAPVLTPCGAERDDNQENDSNENCD